MVRLEGAQRLKDLIAYDLHRHGEVQRRIGRRSRYLQVQVTTLQLFVVQTVVLASEQNGAAQVTPLNREARRDFLCIRCRPGNAARPGTRSHHPLAICDRFVDAVHHPRRIQHVQRTCGAPVCLGIGKTLGIDQVQLRQSHGLEGPGSAADVARMTGLNEDDSQIRIIAHFSAPGKTSVLAYRNATHGQYCLARSA